jgi:MerR family mercuric resistance operon transcriptional regulator
MVAIGTAARRSGVGVETIRYYEREGLVPAPPRRGNGRRDYDEAAVARLHFVRRCRSFGFSLAETRQLLALAGQAETNCAAAAEVGAHLLLQVRERLAELARLEAALAQVTSTCGAGRSDCGLLRVLQGAAPGPVSAPESG